MPAAVAAVAAAAATSRQPSGEHGAVLGLQAVKLLSLLIVLRGASEQAAEGSAECWTWKRFANASFTLNASGSAAPAEGTGSSSSSSDRRAGAPAGLVLRGM